MAACSAASFLAASLAACSAASVDAVSSGVDGDEEDDEEDAEEAEEDLAFGGAGAGFSLQVRSCTRKPAPPLHSWSHLGQTTQKDDGVPGAAVSADACGAGVPGATVAGVPGTGVSAALLCRGRLPLQNL